MFTEGKGKAFSYFSVVAKNYLILKNNASYKEGLRSSYLSDTANDESFSLEEVLTVTPESETHRYDAKNFIQLLIQYWDFNLTRIFKKKKDLEVANAVVELLRRSNTTENFNKKALYLLIREMTNYKTVHITKVLNKMKIYVFQQLKEYRQTGHISDPSTFFTYKQKK
jgi:predicted membrane chloride channel (bestrophin family)